MPNSQNQTFDFQTILDSYAIRTVRSNNFGPRLSYFLHDELSWDLPDPNQFTGITISGALVAVCCPASYTTMNIIRRDLKRLIQSPEQVSETLQAIIDQSTQNGAFRTSYGQILQKIRDSEPTNPDAYCLITHWYKKSAILTPPRRGLSVVRHTLPKIQ